MAEDGGDNNSDGSWSRSHHNNQMDDEEEAIFGYLKDLLLTFCGRVLFRALGLREVLQLSVQVLEESGLGILEKVVLWDGAFFATKHFRRVYVARAEFGRRIESLTHVSAGCQYLVPLRPTFTPSVPKSFIIKTGSAETTIDPAKK